MCRSVAVWMERKVHPSGFLFIEAILHEVKKSVLNVALVGDKNSEVQKCVFKY